MIVSKRVNYSGRVQGVGFRYTTHDLAQDYPIVGYVRNQTDGTVELVAEGEAEQVEAFLAAVLERMGDHIRRVTVHEEPSRGYEGFEIRR